MVARKSPRQVGLCTRVPGNFEKRNQTTLFRHVCASEELASHQCGVWGVFFPWWRANLQGRRQVGLCTRVPGKCFALAQQTHNPTWPHAGTQRSFVKLLRVLGPTSLHFPSPPSARPFLIFSLSSALPLRRRPLITTIIHPDTIATTTVAMFRHGLFSKSCTCLGATVLSTQ